MRVTRLVGAWQLLPSNVSQCPATDLHGNRGLDSRTWQLYLSVHADVSGIMLTDKKKASQFLAFCLFSDDQSICLKRTSMVLSFSFGELSTLLKEICMKTGSSVIM